jgi:GNAT superfamily N-acetyltransferase
MALVLQPATEADAVRAADIEKQAFMPNPFGKFLFPGPFPEPAPGQEPGTVQMLKHLKDPSTRWLKVVDTDIEPSEDNSQMIGFAQWNINDGSQIPATPRGFGPGCNVEACEAVFVGLADKRAKTAAGKKHVRELKPVSYPPRRSVFVPSLLDSVALSTQRSTCLPTLLSASTDREDEKDLRLLVVDPKHQRRGAGRMLVMWGIEEAKKLGLPAYVESSVEGHSLYLSCGFRDVDKFLVDFTKWGKPADHVSYILALEQ